MSALKVYGVHVVLEIAPVLLAVEQMSGGRQKVNNGGIGFLIGASPSMHAAQGINTAAARALASTVPTADADVVTNAETQALRFSIERPDIRILMNVTAGLYRIVARRSSGIETLKDLRGKKISTFPRTSAAYYLFRELQSVGLKESDVQIVPLAPITEISAAIGRREVDAIAIWEPASQEAIELLGSDAIEFQTPGLYREIFNLNTLAGKLADPAKREQIVVFLRAVIAAAKQIREDPERAWQLTAQYSGYDINLIKRSWKHHRFEPHMPADLLDVLVEEDKWIAAETNRRPRTRAELSTLIDDSAYREAIS